MEGDGLWVQALLFGGGNVSELDRSDSSHNTVKELNASQVYTLKQLVIRFMS